MQLPGYSKTDGTLPPNVFHPLDRSLLPNKLSRDRFAHPQNLLDNLQVQFESDGKDIFQFQVLSVDGRVLSLQTTAVNEGTNLRGINISNLLKGSYLLKVKSGKVEQVVKFDKL